MRTYLDGMRDESRWPNVLIVGAYPPPYGGVGVHVKRLAGRLEAAGEDYAVYNTVSSVEVPPRVRSIARWRRIRFLGLCLLHRSKVIHLNSTHWYSHLVFGVASLVRSGTHILSIHNMRTNDILLDGGAVRRRLTAWFLRRMDFVLACNEEVVKACVDVAGVPRERVHLVPAFIPPDAQNAPLLPASVQAYVRQHTPALMAVHIFGRIHRGTEIYGLDMVIGLAERLRRDYPRLGIVVTILGGDADVRRRAADDVQARVGDRVYLVQEPLPDPTRLFQACDLFLRPTNTDGDAISIREALSLGTPVVASDVVARPEPCILFRNRDMDDFERAVREALAEGEALRERVRRSDMGDAARAILALYREVLELPRLGQ